MKIGIVGAGKLGLPVALAIEDKGHEVVVWDTNLKTRSQIDKRVFTHQEEGVHELLSKSNIKVVPLSEIVKSNIIFLAVQTPHEPKYEGITPLPKDRKDFDYYHLVKAVRDIVGASKGQKINLVIISTVLPGTIEREILPLLTDNITLTYNPFFIAMGTVIQDFLNPEFVLLGGEKNGVLAYFYTTIHDKPLVWTDYKTAEGIKVFYNTAITSKIILANTWMQVADKMGMNVDAITFAMSLATDRVISPKYMFGGGPDSGGCHPRDLIALSWLGEQIELTPNWFEIMAQAREEQTEWTADLIVDKYFETKLPVVILGKTFKPETNLTVGSGAILLSNLLKGRNIEHTLIDPHVDEEVPKLDKAIYFVATKHPEFAQWEYPEGSVILDLWRYIPKSDKYEVIHIGNRI